MFHPTVRGLSLGGSLHNLQSESCGFCRLLFYGDVIIMGMFGSAIVVVLNHEYAMN